MNHHLYKTEAVVLERRDFGEADRLLTLYTPSRGKVRAIAKGSRRTTSRLSGHIELFTHTGLMLACGRNLDIVTQSQLIHSHERLREDLWRAALGYYVVELVNRFSEDRLESFAVWQALLGVLRDLDGPAEGTQQCIELAVRRFELRLLEAMGYRPELRSCTGCRERLEAVENYYHAESGGLLCPGCADGYARLIPLSVDAVKVLRVLQDGDEDVTFRLRLRPELQRDIEHVVRRHITHVLEHDVHSAHLIDELRMEQGSLS
ncbi:MAG: DNA repair protein RecO [Chloroflexota bacterium]